MRQVAARHKWIGLIIAGIAGVAVSAALMAQRSVTLIRSDPLTGPFRAVFALERKDTHLGGGVAISSDGGMLAYIADDNSLHVRELSSGNDRLLVKEVGPGIDVFSSPAFSPDGNLVLFSASGGTRYYPSDIYSIGVHDLRITRLTKSPQIATDQVGQQGGGYGQYFYSAQFAPDGAKILLRVYNTAQRADYVALMDPDGSHAEVVSHGTPLFWTSDSQAIYYSQDTVVKRYNLRSSRTQTIKGLERGLGKLSDREVFAIDTGTKVTFVRLQDDSLLPVGESRIPRVRLGDRGSRAGGASGLEDLVLTSIQASASGRLLLVYRGDMLERLEVVEPI